MGTLKVNGNISATGTMSASSFLGNASSATKWATARTITIGHKGRALDGSSDLTYSPVDIFWNTATVGSTTDWNAILTPGVQMVHGGNGFTGAGNPGNGHYPYGGLYTVGLGGTQEHGHIAQFYIPHNMSGAQGIVYRSGWYQTYNSWQILLDSRNYTNYCATASHTHSYLPLSGGTVTGTITLSNNYPFRFTNVGNNNAYLAADSQGLYLAVYGSSNKGKSVHIETYDTGIYHRRSDTGTNYEILTAANYSSYALPISGGTLTGITTISFAHTGGGMLQLSSTSNNESSISYNSGGTQYWVVGKGCGGTGNGTFAWWYNPSGKNMMTLNSSGNLHLTGNTISFGGNMTQNTSPTVVATYVNNNSANGLGFAYTSNLSVGYATTANETDSGRGGSIPWAGSFDYEPDPATCRSMFSTYMDSSSTWWNLISNRHRNGSSDGNSYGMYIKCRLTGSWNHLLWNRQYGGSWQGERYIHDTGNVCVSSSNPGNGTFYGQIWFKI